MTKPQFQTYLSAIKNSLGSRIFQNIFHVSKKGEKSKDVARGGLLSCAFYVSGVLAMFGLMDRAHATIGTTEKKLLEMKWFKIPTKNLKPGAVVIWKEISWPDGTKYKHMGFIISKNTAISHSYKSKVPTKHNIYFWNLKKKEPQIESIYWHKVLDSK